MFEQRKPPLKFGTAVLPLDNISHLEHDISITKVSEYDGFMTFTFGVLMSNVEKIKYNDVGENIEIEFRHKNREECFGKVC
jgi:hypothetical protein